MTSDSDPYDARRYDLVVSPSTLQQDRSLQVAQLFWTRVLAEGGGRPQKFITPFGMDYFAGNVEECKAFWSSKLKMFPPLERFAKVYICAHVRSNSRDDVFDVFREIVLASRFSLRELTCDFKVLPVGCGFPNLERLEIRLDKSVDLSFADLATCHEVLQESQSSLRELCCHIKMIPLDHCFSSLEHLTIRGFDSPNLDFADDFATFVGNCRLKNLIVSGNLKYPRNADALSKAISVSKNLEKLTLYCVSDASAVCIFEALEASKAKLHTLEFVNDELTKKSRASMASFLRTQQRLRKLILYPGTKDIFCSVEESHRDFELLLAAIEHHKSLEEFRLGIWGGSRCEDRCSEKLAGALWKNSSILTCKVDNLSLVGGPSHLGVEIELILARNKLVQTVQRYKRDGKISPSPGCWPVLLTKLFNVVGGGLPAFLFLRLHVEELVLFYESGMKKQAANEPLCKVA